MIPIGILEGISLIKYNTHIWQLAVKSFDKDHIQKGWNLENYFKEQQFNGRLIRDTIKVNMDPLAYGALLDEWKKRYKNKHRLDGTPWIEKKGKYKARIKSNSGLKWTKVKLGLTGMWEDHHGHLDQLSLKIKLKGEKRLDGEKNINLLRPITRNLFLDELSNDIFNELFGGIRIRYKPYIVSFRKQLPYLLLREDDLGKFLIERNRRRESVIFEKGFGGSLKHLPGIEDLSVDGDFNYELSDKKKQNLLSTEISKLFNSDTNVLFTRINHKQFVGALATSMVFSSWHNMVDINLHWYYNPVNNLFEPLIREIQWDPRISFPKDNATFADRKKHYKLWFNFFDTGISHQVSSVPVAYFRNRMKLDSNQFWADLDQAVYQISTSIIKQIEQDGRFKEPISNYTNFERERVKSLRQRLIKISKRFTATKPFSNTKKHIEPVKEIIWKGTVIINEIKTIRNNQKLIVQPGTNVLFEGVNPALLIYGEINCKGTTQQPVLFRVKNKNTRASIYMESSRPLIFTETNFDGLSSLSQGMWNLPSAVTAHNSNHVYFTNCVFQNNRIGDDMLNIFGCDNFKIYNCRFMDILSDAFDSDFSNGSVFNCEFKRIGNDGVDGSGSNINITSCTFNNVKDKAISAGEKSNFSVFNSMVSNSEIGFVSKDQSILTVSNCQQKNNQLEYAIFQKKPEYGPAKLIVDIDLNKHRYLVQKNCSIKHQGGKIKKVKDVESKLYGNEFGTATKK